MDKRILTKHLVATLMFLCGIPAQAQADAAQVLYTSDKLTVIDANGVERIARQGDFLNPGDRVLTAPGVIGQIKLPDGTLLSTRPDSEIKLDVIDRAKGKNVLLVNHGNVRIINVDLPNRPRLMPIDVVTPMSTMQLTDGDGEAIHVRPGNKANVEAGTYTRLQLGSALMRNGKGDLPLIPLQGGFVPHNDSVPINIAALPPILANFIPTAGTLVGTKPPLISGASGPLSGFALSANTSLLTSNTFSSAEAPLLTGGTLSSAGPFVPATGGGTGAQLGAQPVVGSALVQSSALPLIQAQTLNTAIKLTPPKPPPYMPPRVFAPKVFKPRSP